MNDTLNPEIYQTDHHQPMEALIVDSWEEAEGFTMSVAKDFNGLSRSQVMYLLRLAHENGRAEGYRNGQRELAREIKDKLPYAP